MLWNLEERRDFMTMLQEKAVDMISRMSEEKLYYGYSVVKVGRDYLKI